MKSQNMLALLCLLSPISALAQTQGSSPSPVLVELFTSQGCSSCPPAENLLNTWGMEWFQKGEILPLAFHVDYWDYLGWPDPFGSALFTGRQKEYASALSSSLYTPQMVVSGLTEFVGSDFSKAEEAVTRFQKSTPRFHIGLKAFPYPHTIKLQITIGLPASTEEALPEEMWMVVFENGLETRVEKGENAGKTLEENFVVRRLMRLHKGPGDRDSAWETSLSWDPHWNRARSGIAVFIQDPSSLEIKALRWVYPLVKG